MNLPLFSYDLLSENAHLMGALLIGVAFGFVLERGGLGNAKKLIGQFLLKDFVVFKVMFTAIVTAMVGLFFLSVLGLINLQLISFPDSYLSAQIIGGLLLGMGFAIAGYCPGTTVVGMATGKLDALLCFLGLFVGTWLFVAAFNVFESLYRDHHLATDKLPELLSLPFGTVVMLIIAVAIGGFYISEKIEGKR
ncbi:YeeE/YedE thiosulfate transporter family protein [Marinicella sp. W31]|uniref:YeeE/YedE thiosulfate transporter family protein n=1 Tax=Marinicella sp. W31 TaxID=3023713 RepID=UPI00375810E0